MSAPLPSAAEKRACVRSMFDRISPRYDLVNRVMTLGIDRAWRRAAIRALSIAPRERLLDLACGTGDLGREGARAGARVIGVDFSAGMLRRARLRGADVALVRADALALPLADASCDAVVSGFALRNFTDLGVALAEAGRVLKPGGRLALLEVDTPAGRLWRLGHRLYFHRVVPLVGALLSDREAYSYLPASTAYLPSEPELRRMLEASGFASIEKRRLASGAAQLVTARRKGALGGSGA